MMRSTGNFSPEWGYLAPAPSLLRTVRVVLVATAVGATAGAGVVLSLVDHSTGDGEQVSAAAHAIVTSAQAAPVQAAPVRAVTAPMAPVANAAPIAAAAPVVAEAKSVPANVTTAVATPAVQAPAQNPIQAAPQIQAAAPPMTQPDNAAPAAAMAAPSPRQAANTPADGSSDANAVATPPQPLSSQPAVAALTDAAVAAPGTTAITNDATGSDQTAPAVALKKSKHHTTANGAFGNGPNLGSALRHLFSARAGTSYYPNRGL
jgi:hypothetical protein